MPLAFKYGSWLSVPVNFSTASSNTMRVSVKKMEPFPFPTLTVAEKLDTDTNSLFLIAARRAERNHREDKGDGTEQWPLL